MKHLSKAIHNAHFDTFYTPIDNSFEKYIKDSDTESIACTRDWSSHILAQALLVLRKKKVHFAELQDIQDFKNLVSIVRNLKETKHEEKQITRRGAQSATEGGRAKRGRPARRRSR